MSTKGIAGQEPDPRVVYADIIDLPHHQSPTRPHMRLYDRAAQFSSFDALAGYSDMVIEEARLTDRQIELGEHDLEILNRRLNWIAAQITEGLAPEVTVTFYVPDDRKEGGSYQRYTGTVKKVDPILQQLFFYPEDGSRSGMAVDLSLVSDLAGGDIGDADDV